VTLEQWPNQCASVRQVARKERSEVAVPRFGRGGARRGAGRKPANGHLREGPPHRARSEVNLQVPVLVTLRLDEDIAAQVSTRKLRTLAAEAVEAARKRFGCQILEHGYKSERLMLVCRAESEVALSRGVKGVAVRLARAINRVIGRKGQVFAHRYQTDPLPTKTELTRIKKALSSL
jgi:putative transposase